MSPRGRPGVHRGGGSRDAPRKDSRIRRPTPAPETIALSNPAMSTALLVAFAGVVASVTYALFETDVWQHLLVGKAIWRLGHVPTTQLWAWASHGDPEVNSAWLFRALIFQVWSLGEVWGLFAWRWATTLVAFSALWATARAMGARGFAALIVLVACALVYRPRSQIRPETLVAVLLALEIKSMITGQSAGPEVEAQIRTFIGARAEIAEILSLISLQQGDGVMLAVKARMREEQAALRLVEDINQVEAAIRAAFPQVRWLFFEPDLHA